VARSGGAAPGYYLVPLQGAKELGESRLQHPRKYLVPLQGAKEPGKSGWAGPTATPATLRAESLQARGPIAHRR
jgi:hypothetical protein